MILVLGIRFFFFFFFDKEWYYQMIQSSSSLHVWQDQGGIEFTLTACFKTIIVYLFHRRAARYRAGLELFGSREFTKR